jgi:dTDP-4-dehydrorhamnose 3,5-epimerase-like enzyme
MTFSENAKHHFDNRGVHSKFFERKISDENKFGEVHEVFMTTNNHGTLRGLHFQTNPTQQKLTKVVSGHFNIRVVSTEVLPHLEFADWAASATCGDITYFIYGWDWANDITAPIFVPENAMLGYLSLEDNAKMLYIADGAFCGQADTGYSPLSVGVPLNWNAKAPDIEYILSEKDLMLPPLPGCTK